MIFGVGLLLLLRHIILLLLHRWRRVVPIPRVVVAAELIVAFHVEEIPLGVNEGPILINVESVRVIDPTRWVAFLITQLRLLVVVIVVGW